MSGTAYEGHIKGRKTILKTTRVFYISKYFGRLCNE